MALELPTYPAVLWGSRRLVDGTRGKCWNPRCLTNTGSRYGSRYVCSRCALEQEVIERRAEEQRQAVAR